jgi:Ser/Thr protein kinase RdoA (MazF antagonist)
MKKHNKGKSKMRKLHEIIEKNYNIGAIAKIEKTTNGSGNTYMIETNVGKYIAKVNERIDFVSIYNKVERALNSLGFIQSCIIKTTKNKIMASEGVVLYEYINGENHLVLSEAQSNNAIKYMKEYNKALKMVPFNKEEISVINYWDKARSLDFIIRELPTLTNKSQLEEIDRKNICETINILTNNKLALEKQGKQLIHSDLGADNFIFQGNEVISIIDFTPDNNHELYSLCQFIYWNYLWSANDFDIRKVNNYLSIYNSDGALDNEDKGFYLLLLNTALYRITGPLIDKHERGISDYSSLKKRFFILDKLLKNLTKFYDI